MDRPLYAVVGVGGCQLPTSDLEKYITRRRPRGSGSRRQLAEKLRDALDRRSHSSWLRLCKGQRRPTASQILVMEASIRLALEHVNARCRTRTLDRLDVIRCGYAAHLSGRSSVDGGRVTANSYKYRWTTTRAVAFRKADGDVRVVISRDGRERAVDAPGTWWDYLLNVHRFRTSSGESR